MKTLVQRYIGNKRSGPIMTWFLSVAMVLLSGFGASRHASAAAYVHPTVGTSRVPATGYTQKGPTVDGRLHRTILSYKAEDDHHHHDPRSGEQEGPRSEPKTQAPSSDSAMTIPVLGPIPGEPPLLVGAELVLHPPTPLQWYTLEEAALIQRQEEEEEEQPDEGQSWNENQDTLSPSVAASGTGFHGASSRDARINAAPLVAIMDDISIGDGDHNLGHAWKKAPNGGPNGKRYATLAAVVGMNLASSSTTSDSTSSSFWQSFQGGMIPNKKNQVVASQSKIRLVGIGRAALSNFFYRMPSQMAKDVQDDEGYLQHVDLKVQQHLHAQQQREEEFDQGATNEQEEEEEEDDDLLRLNIVMAQVRVLHDHDAHSQTGALSSPVHTVAKMSTWASRLQLAHSDRQQLVTGLQTAKARLQLVGLRQDLYDHDGLGELFWPSLQDDEQDGPHATPGERGDPLTLMDGAAESHLSSSLNYNTQTTSPVGDLDNPTVGEMENYGMGYSAASVCTLLAMTRVWMETLEPYYSPQWQKREEYHYELFSFVTLLALRPFLNKAQLSWSLQCTNTVERLERTHEWMTHHVRLLQQERDRVRHELEQCGEQCTDLW